MPTKIRPTLSLPTQSYSTGTTVEEIMVENDGNNNINEVVAIELASVDSNGASIDVDQQRRQIDDIVMAVATAITDSTTTSNDDNKDQQRMSNNDDDEEELELLTQYVNKTDFYRLIQNEPAKYLRIIRQNDQVHDLLTDKFGFECRTDCFYLRGENGPLMGPLDWEGDFDILRVTIKSLESISSSSKPKPSSVKPSQSTTLNTNDNVNNNANDSGNNTSDSSGTIDNNNTGKMTNTHPYDLFTAIMSFFTCGIS